jgi:hypothetical protein
MTECRINPHLIQDREDKATVPIYTIKQQKNYELLEQSLREITQLQGDVDKSIQEKFSPISSENPEIIEVKVNKDGQRDL